MFECQPHFTKITELAKIDVPELRAPRSMVASTRNYAIYISDYHMASSCIRLIDVREKFAVSSWALKKGGTPELLSITPTGLLLVSAVRTKRVFQGQDGRLHICYSPFPSHPYTDPPAYISLETYYPENKKLQNCISLPDETESVSCVTRMPDTHFLVCYRKFPPTSGEKSEYVICILSQSEGILWRLDASFLSLDSKWKHEPYYFAIDKDGYIFLSDRYSNKVVLLNPQMTEYSSILSHEYDPVAPTLIVYTGNCFGSVPEYLLVQSADVPDRSQKPESYEPVISILRLSRSSPAAKRQRKA